MSAVLTNTTRNETMKLFRNLVWLAAMLTGIAAQAGTVTYYHNDIAGSPAVATNAAGQVLWRESYRPYGERLTNAPASVDNKIWFTSRRQDVETGLVYMGARYYDPVVGRFISRDPVEFDGSNIHSHNRYAYGNNNPYRYVDPDGRNPILIAMGVGALINGGINAAAQYVSTGAVQWTGLGGVIDAAGDGMLLGLAGVRGSSSTVAAERAEAAVDKTVYRLGDSAESASRLGRKSAEAEKQIGQHGVSVSTTKPSEGVACSSASCAGLEARGFDVRPTPTRSDTNHHTVILPKPVTKEVAKDFNQAFGRN